jgi:hypothetical protein
MSSIVREDVFRLPDYAGSAAKQLLDPPLYRLLDAAKNLHRLGRTLSDTRSATYGSLSQDNPLPMTSVARHSSSLLPHTFDFAEFFPQFRNGMNIDYQ